MRMVPPKVRTVNAYVTTLIVTIVVQKSARLGRISGNRSGGRRLAELSTASPATMLQSIAIVCPPGIVAYTAIVAVGTITRRYTHQPSTCDGRRILVGIQ